MRNDINEGANSNGRCVEAAAFVSLAVLSARSARMNLVRKLDPEAGGRCGRSAFDRPRAESVCSGG